MKDIFKPRDKKKEFSIMTKKIFYSSVLSLLAVLFLISFSFAKEGEDANGSKPLRKTMTDDNYNYIDINQILRWIANNGNGSYDPNTGVAGLYWPKGTANTAVYEDGIVYGGYVSGGNLPAGTSQLRLIGSTYRQPFQAGKIIDTLNGKPVADDASLEKYRIFKIEKNFKQYATTDPAKYARMKKDFLEWPGDDGAPYIDNNSSGTFDPPTLDANDNVIAGDEPLFLGDQMIFHVSNDANPSKTNFCYGSDPMGIEVQRLLWGYSLTGVMGNSWFERWTLINKGAYSIDSMYIGYWSDTDLGDGNDDFSGCDTTLQLGYTYNGEAADYVYGIPPADGYVLLQGPLFPSSTDTAIYTWGKGTVGSDNVAGFAFNKRPGYKNARMSSYAYYINRSSVYRDPQFNTTGATEFYRYLKGLIWDGREFINPNTGQPTTFTLTGDPVAGTGWIDGAAATMGDRRQLMSCGPFTMAPGDTQEIVIGFNISQGGDYLASVTLLKDAARILHTVYDLQFNLPSPPPAPVAKISELPDRIVLDWSDATTSAITEGSSVSLLGTTYDFQGYNIYQLPSPTASLSEAKKLTTFDLNDSITIVLNDEYDSKLGITLPKVSQTGTNSGIQRYYVIEQDYINGGPLIKGKRYYYAVTAYSYNPAPPFGTHDLENPFTGSTVYLAIPQDAKPGEQHASTPLQDITTERLSGTATPTVTAQVIDPKKITGSNYRVVFHAPSTIDTFYFAYADYPSNDPNNDYGWYYLDSLNALPNVSQWSVIRTSTGDTVIKRSTNLVADNSSPIADGIQFKVDGYPFFDQDKIIKEVTYTPEANNNTTPAYTRDLLGSASAKQGFMPTTALLDEQFLGMGANYGYPAYQDTFKIEIRFADPADNINMVGWSKAYAYLAKAYRAEGANVNGVVLPVHQDPVNNMMHSNNWWYVRSSYGGMLYEGLYDSPLQVWDVTDSTSPRQLSWVYLQVDSLLGPLQDSILAAPYTTILRDWRGGGDNSWNTPRYFTYSAGDTVIMNRFIANPDRANRYTIAGAFDFRHGMITVLDAPYSTTINSLWARTMHNGFYDALAQDNNGLVTDADGLGPGMMPAIYTGNFYRTNSSRPSWNAGDKITIYPSRPLSTATVYDFNSSSIPSGAVTGDANLAKQQVAKVNVFPNPYFGANAYEGNKYQRFVTFTHMPKKATVRIFNLAGTLVNKLTKNDDSQFFNWDLRNQSGLPVASGMYIVYIDMETLGTKILKLGVVMEAQFLDRI
jgi:hypothetical protein